MGANVMAAAQPCKQRTRPSSSDGSRFAHHDGHVVLTPTGEGEVDERLAHSLRLFGAQQMLADLLVRDVLREAVSTQQHDIPPLELERADLRIDLRAPQ